VNVTNTTTNAAFTDVRCQANGVPASYTYTWEHTWPGNTSVLRTLPGTDVLRLKNLTYEYSGFYTCRVENGVTVSRNPGAGTGTAYLLVKGTIFNISSIYLILYYYINIIFILLSCTIKTGFVSFYRSGMYVTFFSK